MFSAVSKTNFGLLVTLECLLQILSIWSSQKCCLLVGWLVGWLYCHFNSQSHIMAVVDAHVFPGFLLPVLTQISFQSHRLHFSHPSEVRGEIPLEVHLNLVTNSQPPVNESDTLTTEQTRQVVICYRALSPFPNKPWILRVCSRSLLKTLWEKEKLLLMSNLSFSHNVFYSF